MKLTKELLFQRIIEFMIIIYDCRINTSYANDRSIYSENLVYVMSWIKALENNVAPEIVVKEILESNEAKHFCDYFRGGVWGEKEINGFVQLQKDIQAMV